MKKFCLSLFVCLFLIVGLANATTIERTVYLQGINNGFNTATVEFEYNSIYNDHYEYGYYGNLDIWITNTGDYDPVITGFAFNVPDQVTGINWFKLHDPYDSNENWSGVLDPDSISTPEPYGKFDVAGMTGNNIRGGKPQLGIPAGKSY